MWELIRILHLLAMAFFVGGQLVLAAAVVPVMRDDPDPERTRLRAMARSFGVGSAAALGVLLATGFALAGDLDRWEDSLLQVKLALVLAIVVLIAWHARAPRNHALEALVFAASLAVVTLGVLIAH